MHATLPMDCLWDWVETLLLFHQVLITSKYFWSRQFHQSDFCTAIAVVSYSDPINLLYLILTKMYEKPWTIFCVLSFLPMPFAFFANTSQNIKNFIWNTVPALPLTHKVCFVELSHILILFRHTSACRLYFNQPSAVAWPSSQRQQPTDKVWLEVEDEQITYAN